MVKKKDEYKKITSDTKLLLSGQEGLGVDFKTEAKAIKAEDLVALANARGGTILAGVSETESDQGVQRGKVTGCAVDDSSKLVVTNRAASCRPSITVSIQVENTASNRPILRVDVPEGNEKPYCTNFGTYKIRSEGQNVAIDPPLMKAMILEIESKEFIQRFRHAAEDLLNFLNRMKDNLSGQMESVENAAKLAEEAAQEAGAAAEEAAAAAMDL